MVRARHHDDVARLPFLKDCSADARFLTLVER
jgi:hypothetical protein